MADANALSPGERGSWSQPDARAQAGNREYDKDHVPLIRAGRTRNLMQAAGYGLLSCPPILDIGSGISLAPMLALV